MHLSDNGGILPVVSIPMQVSHDHHWSILGLWGVWASACTFTFLMRHPMIHFEQKYSHLRSWTLPQTRRMLTEGGIFRAQTEYCPSLEIVTALVSHKKTHRQNPGIVFIGVGVDRMGKNVFQIGRLYVVMSMDYYPVAEGGILSQSFTISKGSDTVRRPKVQLGKAWRRTKPFHLTIILMQKNSHAKNASCAKISVTHVFPLARQHWIMS